MKKRVVSLRDLEIYQRSYEAAIAVIRRTVPRLPREDKFDQADQHRRSTKAIHRLTAEGYSMRHQTKGFQKYLDDALAEGNETIVSPSQARDICVIEKDICGDMTNEYEIISRKICTLALVWTSFGRKNLETVGFKYPDPNPINISKEVK